MIRSPLRTATALLAVAILAGFAQPARAQIHIELSQRDSLTGERDTLGLSVGVSQRPGRLLLASGKTYNRVEGLPVHAGPVFSLSGRRFRFGAEAFGILRSADTFRWDSRNLGHVVATDIRSIGPAGFSLRLSGYDIVAAVEDWQMSRGEAGLGSFLLHRDYRDHFGRHGASVTASLFSGTRALVEVGFADERWSSLEVRKVLTLLRNNHQWRANPEVDDGHARVLTVRGGLDTRNDARNPSTGWLARVEYERGEAEFDELGPTSALARTDQSLRPVYGRALLDVRRYNRLSAEAQLNFRIVAGGWLHGDELPLQRRFSIGGPATIPGVHFRDATRNPDVYTCSASEAIPGIPAQCERVLLLQAEFREELPFRPGTIFGGTPIRIRSAALTLRPVLVLFADAGRGWLLPQSDVDGTAGPLMYGKGKIPGLSTFSTDVGVGVDLGLIGAYLAVSMTESGAPLTLTLRSRSRF